MINYRSSALARNAQQELAGASLRFVAAAAEIWFNSGPASATIEVDQVFVEPFFAAPDVKILSKLRLQSPWLLRRVAQR